MSGGTLRWSGEEEYDGSLAGRNRVSYDQTVTGARVEIESSCLF